jgi:hypothetical protein
MGRKTKVFDNGKLLYIDPSPKGSIPNSEDLTIYVELEMLGKKRSKIILNKTENITIESERVKTVKFVGNETLTTNYTNIGGVSGYDTEVNTQSMGINSISIKFDTSYTPMVSINFTDIRGDSLFKQLENNQPSEYAQLMQLPYPMFKLTVKGYYGRGTTYILHLLKLETSFDDSSGNFNFVGEFIGYTYAFLADNIFNYLRAYANTDEGKNELKAISSSVDSPYKIDGLSELPNISDLILRLKSLQLNIQNNETVNTNKTTEVKDNEKKIEGLVNILNFLRKGFFEDIKIDNYNPNYDYYQFVKSINFIAFTTEPNKYGSNVADIYKYREPDINIVDEDEYDKKIQELNNSNIPYNFNSNDISLLFNYYNNDKLLKYGKWLVENKIGSYNKETDLLFEFYGLFDESKLKGGYFDKVYENDENSYVIYNPTLLINKLNEFIKVLEDKNEEIINNLTEKQDIIFDSILGFKPTIGNVFKVLLAHSEIFMNAIDKLSVKISNSSDRGSSDEFLNPFPTYVDDTDNTYKWVGSNPRVAYLVTPEINFINLLLNELIGIRLEEEYLEITTNGFKPTLTTDVYYQGINPYLKYRNDGYKLMLITMFRLYEYYLSYPLKGQGYNDFLKNEIDNIFQVVKSNINVLDSLKRHLVYIQKYLPNVFHLVKGSQKPYRIFPYISKEDNLFIPNSEILDSIINELTDEEVIYNGTKTDILNESKRGNIIESIDNQVSIKAMNYSVLPIENEVYLKNGSLKRVGFVFYNTVIKTPKYAIYQPSEKYFDSLDDKLKQGTSIYKKFNFKYLSGLSLNDSFTNIFFDKNYYQQNVYDRAKLFLNNLLNLEYNDVDFVTKIIVDTNTDGTPITAIYRVIPRIILLYFGASLYFDKSLKTKYPSDLIEILINEFEDYVENDFIKHEDVLSGKLLVYTDDNNINGLNESTPKVNEIFSINKINNSEIKVQYLKNDRFYKETEIIISDLFRTNKLFLTHYLQIGCRSSNPTTFQRGCIYSSNNGDGVKLFNEYLLTPLIAGLNNLKSVIDKDVNILQDSFLNDDIKLMLYNNLKSIYEKWIGDGTTGFSDKTIYSNIINNFKFIDRAYNDISDELIFDINGILNVLAPKQNQSLMDIISRLLAYHKVNFIPLPGYINYSSVDDVSQAFDILPTNEILNTLTSSPSFICMYVGDTSKHLDNQISGFKDDGFDIEVVGDTVITNAKDFNENDGNSNKIVAFGVNYGLPEQSIFTKLNLSQKQFAETEESLLVTDEISKQGALKKSFIGQNLYNIYQTRSYEVSLTSLGNTQIQPLMYFQLNNIPMWHGVYLIKSVSHEISNNSMTTSFIGQRMSRNRTPLVENYSITKGGKLGNKTKNYISNSSGNVTFKTDPPFLNDWYVPTNSVDWTPIQKTSDITDDVIETRSLVNLELLTGNKPNNTKLNNFVRVNTMVKDKPYSNKDMFEKLKVFFLEIKEDVVDVKNCIITGAFGSGHASKSHTTYATAIDFQLIPYDLNSNVEVINKIQSIARKNKLDVLVHKYKGQNNPHFHTNFLGNDYPT